MCRAPNLRRLELRGPGSDAALASVLALADGDEKKSMATEVWGDMSCTGDCRLRHILFILMHFIHPDAFYGLFRAWLQRCGDT